MGPSGLIHPSVQPYKCPSPPSCLFLLPFRADPKKQKSKVKSPWNARLIHLVASRAGVTWLSSAGVLAVAPAAPPGWPGRTRGSPLTRGTSGVKPTDSHVAFRALETFGAGLSLSSSYNTSRARHDLTFHTVQNEGKAK